ncbi:ERCC4 domain protein [Lunatimonas lonarensis]|uniref:ERCC4 domain protein n=1 Tax=Lunatimonas lonarensis TaxID=1232681 RepID=R7ZRM5_9BACT|nr:ERCC4 domain-containing protein [Lunatimonas lonarensis]EON76775.1 ERCC4 domain protein [Lunatimonas lonarensis]
MENAVQITCDYRERPSGIPELLREKGCVVDTVRLFAGDYLVNQLLLVERKTAVDFTQSLVSHRLFNQCALLAKSRFRPVMILEGNPFQLPGKLSTEAIQGAIISVCTAWHIPVIRTDGPAHTVAMLYIIGKQQLASRPYSARLGRKPRRPIRQKAQFLQGLPDVGPVLAERLLEHFGCLSRVLLADQAALQDVPGLGAKKAIGIKRFLEDGIG